MIINHWWRVITIMCIYVSDAQRMPEMAVIFNALYTPIINLSMMMYGDDR